jgi:hypothetical protein
VIVLRDKHCVVVVAATILVAGLSAGCGAKNDNGLSPSQHQVVSRVSQIETQSGGDWNKVSQSDKDYLTKTVGYGNTSMAKQVLELAARKGPMAEPPPPKVGGPSRPPVSGGVVSRP